MDNTNRRQHDRVNTQLYALVYLRQAKLVHKIPDIADIKDVSASGMRFEASDKFNVGDSFYISFNPVLGETVPLWGDIVWKSASAVKDKATYGARVYSTDGSPAPVLLATVEHVIKHHNSTMR